MAGGGPAVPQLFLSPGASCVSAVMVLNCRLWLLVVPGPAVPIGDDCSRGPGCGEETLPPRFTGPGLGSADTCQCDLNAQALGWTLSRQLEATLAQVPSLPARPPWGQKVAGSPHGPGGPQSWDASPDRILVHLGYFCTWALICSAMSQCLCIPGRTEQADEWRRFWYTWPNVHTSLVGRSSAPRKAAISPSVPTRRQGTAQARGPQGSSQPRLCPPTSTRLTPPSHARCSPASNVLLYDHGR